MKELEAAKWPVSDVPSGETTAIRCLRADSRLLGKLDFGGMKRCDFWRAKRAENFPHNPTCFPHNQHFLPHNVPENFRIICYFFPHPIRCPAKHITGSLDGTGVKFKVDLESDGTFGPLFRILPTNRITLQ